jgi:leucyl aminopeptidase
VPVDQGEGEILIRADERDAVPLEQRRLRRVRTQRLALMDEVGDAPDQVLNADRGVRPQLHDAHVLSLYRLHQKIVKRWKKFSQSAQNLLVHVATADKADGDLVAVAITAAAPPELGVGELLKAEGFKPEAGAATLLHVDSRRIAVAGLGTEIDADAFRTAAGAVARLTQRIGGSLAWILDESQPVPIDEQARAVVDGILLGGYDPGRWKSSEADRNDITRLVFVGPERVAEGAAQAATVAAWANRARDLAHEPANILTPERLAEHASEIAAGSEHLTVEAGGPERLAELGMGAFGAVAQGSHNPPRLIVIRYDPPDARGDVVLGLVGKAVTFDTGGISIKPALYMEDMKGDMAGGAAVVAGIGAIAELGLPLRVIAVVGAAENMPGGGSYRPGDILTAMNGKTIEVVNTDAEGRLVLADVLWYARTEGATHVVDFATLTGVMNKALGDLYTGVFGSDEGWRDKVVAAGNRSGDHAWPWPMHRRYRRLIDSAFADVKNTSWRGQASPAYAAEFLKEFVGEGPWAHVDMAGPGYIRWPRPDYFPVPGGTGYGVRLIAELARSLA